MSFRVLLFWALASSVAGASCLGRESLTPSSSSARTPVLIARGDWWTSKFNARVAQILLEEVMGVSATLVDYTDDLPSLLLSRKIDMVLEVWAGDAALLAPLVSANSAVSAGLLGVVGRIGWYWPRYVIEAHPSESLSNWAEASAAELGAAWDLCNHSVVYGPKSWSVLDDHIVGNNRYNLTFSYSANESQLFDRVVAMYRRKDSFLAYLWTPHWSLALMNFTRVTLPSTSGSTCNESDPERYSCDFPQDLLKKFTTPDFADKSPRANSLVASFNLRTEDHTMALARSHLSGETAEEVACRWVLDNRDRWSKWIPAADKHSNTAWAVAAPVAAGAVLLAVAACVALWMYFRRKGILLTEENQRLKGALNIGIIDTPAERVLQVLSRLSKRRGAPKSDKADINFVYSVIASRSLDRPELNPDKAKGVDQDVLEYLDDIVFVRRHSLHDSRSEQNAFLEGRPEAYLSNLRDEADAPEIPHLTDLEFDAPEEETRQEKRLLSRLGLQAFRKAGLFEAFPIDDKKFVAYCHELERRYKDNPYHNSTHAADVTQFLFHLMCSGDLKFLTSLEKLSLLFAGLIHDVEHPGRNNNWMMATSHPLAIAYNDISVLENMHAARAFQMLREESLNFLEGLSPALFKDFRKMVVQLILSTDMARHVEISSEFKTRAGASNLDLANGAADRLMLMRVLIKAADICNPARPWDLARKWADRVAEEFFQQGDDEKKRGLQVSPMMDRDITSLPKMQASFIEYVVLPLFAIVVPVVPVLSHGVENLKTNLSRWHGLNEVQEHKTAAPAPPSVAPAPANNR